MNTVLSYQNAKPNGRDILVINGELSEYRGTEEQNKAQDLTNPSQCMKAQAFLSWIYRKGGASSSMRLYYNKNKGVIITSNLISKDEIGRKMVYSFFSDEINSPIRVRKLLEDYCTIANVKPNNKDCEAIEKLLRFQKSKNKCIAVAVAVLMAIVFLISKCNSRHYNDKNNNYGQTKIETSSLHLES